MRESSKPERGTWCSFHKEIRPRSTRQEDIKKESKKLTRCPACNRRLKLNLYNCEHPHAACYHLRVPRHKLRKTKTK